MVFVSHSGVGSSPAMVLRKMRYSKLEISRRCQRWVMLAALNSCFGVASEIRLQIEGHRPFNLSMHQGNPPSLADF